MRDDIKKDSINGFYAKLRTIDRDSNRKIIVSFVVEGEQGRSAENVLFPANIGDEFLILGEEK